MKAALASELRVDLERALGEDANEKRELRELTHCTSLSCVRKCATVQIVGSVECGRLGGYPLGGSLYSAFKAVGCTAASVAVAAESRLAELH